VVAAFLECPLELDVCGLQRLVAFPVGVRGTGKGRGERLLGLLRGALQGGGSSLAGAGPRRLFFGTSSSSFRGRLRPFAVASALARASARVVTLGITRSMPVMTKTR